MSELNSTQFLDLKTERLILRFVKPEDADGIFAIRSNECISKYLNRPLCKSVDEARQFISKITDGMKKNEWVYWAITQKNETQLIGTICLWQFNSERTKAEIGFELLPEFQGRRLMREALMKVIEYGFESLMLKTIEGEVAVDNEKSIQILQRNNFTRIDDIRSGDSEDVKTGTTVMFELTLQQR